MPLLMLTWIVKRIIFNFDTNKIKLLITNLKHKNLSKRGLKNAKYVKLQLREI